MFHDSCGGYPQAGCGNSCRSLYMRIAQVLFRKTILMCIDMNERRRDCRKMKLDMETKMATYVGDLMIRNFSGNEVMEEKLYWDEYGCTVYIRAVLFFSRLNSWIVEVTCFIILVDICNCGKGLLQNLNQSFFSHMQRNYSMDVMKNCHVGNEFKIFVLHVVFSKEYFSAKLNDMCNVLQYMRCQVERTTGYWKLCPVF